MLTLMSTAPITLSDLAHVHTLADLLAWRAAVTPEIGRAHV